MDESKAQIFHLTHLQSRNPDKLCPKFKVLIYPFINHNSAEQNLLLGWMFLLSSHTLSQIITLKILSFAFMDLLSCYLC